MSLQVGDQHKSLALSLDEILSRRVSSHGPGVQVVLVSPDQVLYEGAVGLANPVINPGELLTTSHQANLYSVSKFFTACCLLKLIEDGKLSARDQVRDYLPPKLQKLVSNNCTIEDLVAHLGGATNPLPLQWVHAPDETVDEAELLAKVLQKHPFRPMPKGGGHLPCRYSNVGYWVLGHVVMTVCNANPGNFVACCRELLLSDISKDEADSIVSDAYASDAPMAYGHVPRWSMLALVARLACPKNIVGPTSRSWIRMEPHLPDGTSYGGLIGSTRSVSIFLQCLLHGSILSSIEPLFTPRVHPKMTFGLHVRAHRGVRVYHKEGGGAGCHSSIQFRNDALAGCIIAGYATFDVNGLLNELLDCVEDYEKENSMINPEIRTVVTTDGTRLYTKHYSRKPKEATLLGNGAILLISGGPGVPDYLQDVASLLINANITSSVVAFDQRGVGKSVLPVHGEISIDLLLHDIHCIRQAYVLDKIHVLGHSWGGVLGQLYAQRFSDHCRSLLLLSPTTVSQGSDWSNMEIQVMKYNQMKGGWLNFAKMGFWSLLMYVPLVSDFAARQVMEAVFKNYYFDPSTAPTPSAEFLSGVSARAMILSKLSFIKEVDDPIVWKANKIPSHCVFGDEDIYGNDLVGSFCETFNGDTTILKQCSHLAWIAQPRKLEILLRSFYKGIA